MRSHVRFNMKHVRPFKSDAESKIEFDLVKYLQELECIIQLSYIPIFYLDTYCMCEHVCANMS